jgi:hypothetical protein
MSLVFVTCAEGRTIFVTNTNDTTNIASLRGAIISANRTGGNNTIILGQPFIQHGNVNQQIFRLTIAGANEDKALKGDLDITGGNLTIVGVVSNVTIDATGLGDRVFEVFPHAELTLDNLIISGGNVPTQDGAVGESGGAIFNAGRLKMINCLISHNFSGAGTGADVFGTSGGNGGGIYNAGVAELNNCTIANNSTGDGGYSLGYNDVGAGSGGNGGDGGGIYNIGSLWLTNCTVSGNTTGDGGDGGQDIFASGWFQIGGGSAGGNGGDGGGIINYGGFYSFSCTITGNSCGNGGTGGAFLFNDSGLGGLGGGIYNSTNNHVTTGNTLLARNFAGTNGVNTEWFPPQTNPPMSICKFEVGDDVIGDFTSLGFNMLGVGDGSTGFTNNVHADQVGSITNPIDPHLGPLKNNGGLTFTHALLFGSPAIDQGCRFSLTADQRGHHRPHDYFTIPNPPGGDGSDIGAFEADTPILHITGGTWLSWETNCPGYALESTTNMTAPNSWTPVLNVPSVTGYLYKVTNDVTAGNKFFRLRTK